MRTKATCFAYEGSVLFSGRTYDVKIGDNGVGFAGRAGRSVLLFERNVNPVDPAEGPWIGLAGRCNGPLFEAVTAGLPTDL